MSNMYAIKDTTLTALGDAVRSKSNETRIVPLIYNVNEVAKRNCESYDNFTKEFVVSSTTTTMPNKHNSVFCNFKAIEGAKAVRVKGHIKLIGGGSPGNSVDFNFLPFEWKFGQGAPDYTNAIIYNLSMITYQDRESKDIDIILDNTNITTLIVNTDYNSTFTVGYYLEAIGLDENYNSLNNGEITINTQEVVKNTMTPLEMADAINELIVVPDEGLILKGQQMLYNFSHGKNQWLIDMAGDKIKTENLTTLNYAFYENKVIDEVPFVINANPNHTSFTLNYVFKNSSIKSLPKMYNIDVGQMTEMCYYATRLRDIPDDWCETWKWTYAHGTQSYSGGKVFQGCYSLRKLPILLCENIMNRASSTYCNFSYCFADCFTLDEITHMGTIGDVFVLSSNAFTSHINKCYRLKDYIFKLNDDNTPQIVKWKKQVIDFSTVGYADSIGSILNYNSGITADKEVKDDATYQALKNDPDWFSCDINYSRYNHDSAVRTINSLPDTSAYLATQTGTSNNNTIKFKGSAGALTDGGAINTLTEEEIAVATAKGWTVSLV